MDPLALSKFVLVLKDRFGDEMALIGLSIINARRSSSNFVSMAMAISTPRDIDFIQCLLDSGFILGDWRRSMLYSRLHDLKRQLTLEGL